MNEIEGQFKPRTNGVYGDVANLYFGEWKVAPRVSKWRWHDEYFFLVSLQVWPKEKTKTSFVSRKDNNNRVMIKKKKKISEGRTDEALNRIVYR